MVQKHTTSTQQYGAKKPARKHKTSATKQQNRSSKKQKQNLQQ
jgi:hypothetical protein